MGRWGEVDKKKIIYVLETGTDYLKDMVSTKEKDVDTLWSDFRNLHDLFYNEGRELLSITNAVKFERKLNTIRKKLEKGW